MPRFRRNETIANINAESGEDDSDEEMEEVTPATTRLISEEAISLPPSYRLYPSLPNPTEERCLEAWREYLRIKNIQHENQETIAVVHQTGSNCRKATINIRLNGKICGPALVDAGATISLIRTDIASSLGLSTERSHTTATGVTKDTLDIIGQTHVVRYLTRLAWHA